MRLDFLPSGSDDGPLLRLFDVTPAEARQPAAAVAALATGKRERVAVHDLPGVDAVGNCQLVLCRKGWDQAIVRVGPKAFECGFTADTWDNVVGLIEPFTAESANSGFQWLAGAPGEADVVLSPSGQW